MYHNINIQLLVIILCVVKIISSELTSECKVQIHHYQHKEGSSIVCNEKQIKTANINDTVTGIYFPFNLITNVDDILNEGPYLKLEIIDLFANDIVFFNYLNTYIPYIKFLNLASNKLTSISLSIPYLEFIYLNNNFLTKDIYKYIYPMLLQSNTEVVDVSQNNMTCICGITDYVSNSIKIKSFLNNDYCDSDYKCIFNSTCNKFTLSKLQKLCKQYEKKNVIDDERMPNNVIIQAYKAKLDQQNIQTQDLNVQYYQLLNHKYVDSEKITAVECIQDENNEYSSVKHSNIDNKLTNLVIGKEYSMFFIRYDKVELENICKLLFKYYRFYELKFQHHSLTESCDCGLHGICDLQTKKTRCICQLHYSGDKCDTYENKCSKQSECHEKYCTIHGHATICKCPYAFYKNGDCSKRIDFCREEKPCHKSGYFKEDSECILDDNVIRGFICKCKKYFHGPLCDLFSKNICKDMCKHSDGCSYNKTTDKLECICRSGYKNAIQPKPSTEIALCEWDVDQCDNGNSPCSVKHVSKCNASVTGKHNCECKEFATGSYCDKDVNECDDSSYCNNGKCSNYPFRFICHCEKGYTGKTCDKIDCTPACGLNEQCVNDKCVCIPFYKHTINGSKCEKEVSDCNEIKCLNGGTCFHSRETCKCDDRFYGRYCELEKNLCQLGICNNGKCRIDETKSVICDCVHPYEGEFCEIEIDYCIKNPCEYGKCTPIYIYSPFYQCDCNMGYTGYNCSIDIDECEDSLCEKYKSTCVNLINDYYCICNNGWTGLHCDMEEHACDDDYCNKTNTLACTVHAYSKCVCKESFKGKSCNESKGIDDLCTHHGECANIKSTNCYSGLCNCKLHQIYKNGECIYSEYNSKCNLDQYFNECPHLMKCGELTSHCVCDDKYKRINGNCINKTYSDICSEDDHCPLPNMLCINNKCRCKLEWDYTISTNICQLGKLNMPCRNHSNCFLHKSMQQCIKNKCTCNNITYYLMNGICKKRGLGDTCESNEYCKLIIKSECINKKCICKNKIDRLSDGTYNKGCPHRIVGDMCASNYKCDVSYSECLNNTCQCKNGRYFSKKDMKCSIYLKFGDVCDSTKTCAMNLGHIICNKKCICQNGYYYKKGCIKNTLGPCTSDNECYHKHICVSNKCSVKLGYYGDKCNKNNDCLSNNTICGNGNCKCNEESSLNENKVCIYEIKTISKNEGNSALFIKIGVAVFVLILCSIIAFVIRSNMIEKVKPDQTNLAQKKQSPIKDEVKCVDLQSTIEEKLPVNALEEIS